MVASRREMSVRVWKGGFMANLLQPAAGAVSEPTYCYIETARNPRWYKKKSTNLKDVKKLWSRIWHE